MFSHPNLMDNKGNFIQILSFRNKIESKEDAKNPNPI